MPRWRWRGGKRKGPGRPTSDLYLSSTPEVSRFVPEPKTKKEPIEITFPEFNTLTLIDLEGLTQVEAGKRMGVSRGTVYRLYSSARKKISTALYEGRPIELKSKGKIEKVPGETTE